MTEYPQKVTESWSERMRLIRFRRKREKGLRFWQEFKLVPAWLRWTVATLYVLALVIATYVNLNPALNEGHAFPPDIQNNPALASLALAGIVTCVSLFLASYIFMIAYVNRDAKRRGNQLGTVDISRDYPDSRLFCDRLHFVLLDAAAASLRLSTVRKDGRRALQLLPGLQMQSAPVLPAVQTGSRGRRQILPKLRV